jgi:hypothetical protein
MRRWHPGGLRKACARAGWQTRAGKWQISTGGISSYPVWSPNGRELFYRAGTRIAVTDYTETGGSFSSSKPRVWSNREIGQFGLYSPFALALDGKHFAVTPAPEAAAQDRDRPT